ncbi:MAG TPA: ABC transporter ATP-binding protein [Bryobacteraceae bacterium]|nr:ABC transporter ATP-binding protein [Bryobacteraceae bacterium]
MPETRVIPIAQYRRALGYIAPYWRKLVFVVAVSLFATGIGLIQPYISKLLIDEALLRKNFQALVLIAALMVAVTVVGFALNIFSSYQYVRVSADVLFDMRLALYRHLQKLSPRFYARTRTGEIVSRINNDIAEVQRVSADSILSFVSNVAFLLGGAAIMAWLNWRVFLVSAAVMPLSLCALSHYQRRLSAQVRTLRERSADIGSFLIETILGMRLVVATNAQEREVERFRTRNSSFIEALLRMQLTSYLAAAMPGALVTLSTAAIFLYGGKMVIDGALTVGSLVALMAYHLRLLAPVQGMLGTYTNLVAGGVSLSRLFELLDMPVEVEDGGEALGKPVRGEIEFDNVTFRHDRDNLVLDGVSFRVPAGCICAIAGPSGIGKSTIADLLVRFYDPDGGVVRLDGRDLRQIRLADLRAYVALVDQSAYLLHASVRENIAYGRPEASESEIIAAAKAAAIHDRIMELADGYDTIAGERGLALSAGERHRMTIARALLRDPAVLVLDEPTAALDAETERDLVYTLKQAMSGRTAIVITHRAALIEAADCVVELAGNGCRVIAAASP